MKNAIEGLTLFAMSALLCSLTIYGALGVNPSVMQRPTSQLSQ